MQNQETISESNAGNKPELGNLGPLTSHLPETPAAKGVDPSLSSKLHTLDATAFATFVHEYVREYIQLADQKAAGALAVSTAMFGYLESKGYVLDTILLLQSQLWLGLVQLLTILGLSAGISFSLWAILPKLHSLSEQGLVFFGSIANRRAPREYSERVIAAGSEALLVELLEHTHTLAGICSQKYIKVTRAMYATGAGLIGGLLLVIVRS